MSKYNITERIFASVNERVLEFDHESGLHVCIIPKKGFNKKYGVLTTDFGGFNTKYSVNGKIFTVPDGTAHFLEHKLYEQPDGDVMNKFAALGAECNAATGYDGTIYYFECIDNFKECTELLLKHVFHPYFTKENVEKEKGIIVQEINMYLDNPYYVASRELVKLLYKNHPIINDIAGTEESVMSVTPDILYDCHKTFYRPSNMCLSLVGDFDMEEVFAVLKKADLPAASNDIVSKIFPDEPNENAGSRNVCKMETAMPIFYFGFKDDNKKYTGKERIKRNLAGAICSETIFGSSSPLYEKLYDEGYINYAFYSAYEIERDYALFELGGMAENPQKIEEYIKEELSNLARTGINKDDFTRVKNAIHGQRMRSFDSLSHLGRTFGHYYLQGMDGFDYFNACGTIQEDDINDMIKGLLNKEMAVSIVEGVD